MNNVVPLLFLFLCIGGIQAAESPSSAPADPDSTPNSPVAAIVESITLSDGRVLIGVLDERARTITSHAGTMMAVIPLGGATVVARSPAPPENVAPIASTPKAPITGAATRAPRYDALGVTQADLDAMAVFQKRIHDAGMIQAAAQQESYDANRGLGPLRQRIIEQVLKTFPLDLAGFTPQQRANETPAALTARMQATTAYNTLMTDIAAWRVSITSQAAPTRTGAQRTPKSPLQLYSALYASTSMAISDGLGKPRIPPIPLP